MDDNKYQFKKRPLPIYLKIGDRVVVSNCTDKPELNGFTGTIVDFKTKGIWVENDQKEKRWFYDHEVKHLSNNENY